MTPTTEPESTEITPAPAPEYLTPNADGIFEQYEQVLVNCLPVGTAAELRLARGLWGQEVRFYVGYFLVIRSPKNTVKLLPGESPVSTFNTRENALRYLVESVAEKFFAEHKEALKRLRAWKDKTLGRTEEISDQKSEVSAQTAAPALPPCEISLTSDLGPLTSSAPISSHFAAIPVDAIAPNPSNPPERVAPSFELDELAASIRAQGCLLQPIAVLDLGAEARPRYRLIAGHRRWCVHQRLQWPTIEAKVFVGVDDARAGEMALIENLQRRNLNPMEEAIGYVELRDKYGYDVARIHARTGKAESTIKNALRIAALAPEVCALVRAGDLSASHARALAAPRWASRAAHCLALAQWIVRDQVPKSELEAPKLPSAGGRALLAAELATNVSSYRAHLDINAECLVECADGTLLHLEPVQWKAEKAEIDRTEREKVRKEQERAVQKVQTAQTSRVNVRVDDLQKGNLAYIELVGPLERYAEYLPEDIKATGIGKGGEELLVCLRPTALKQLQEREAGLHILDREHVLMDVEAEAFDVIRKLRKIGSREIAFLIERPPAYAGAFDSDAFAALRIPEPPDLTRESLAQLDPLDLVRVFLYSYVASAAGDSADEALRWILNRDKLGFAEETAEGRAKLLEQAGREVFPVVMTEPKTLTEWVKARGAGMSFAEIAKSYGVSEADVRGAVEEK